MGLRSDTCRRRVALLYGGLQFRCRRCYQLVYPSQREDELDRALSRAQDIRIRLGGTGDMFTFFPDRPKGMHRSTYSRLKDNNDRDSQRLSWLMAGRLGCQDVWD